MAKSGIGARKPARPAEVRGYSDMLEATLTGDPSVVLLTANEQRLTRGEVGRRIAALASRLRAAGCGTESLVAIRFDPGADAVIAILAVLATGAAYLPLDPRHGDTRLASIVATTEPDFLLDHTGITPRFDPGERPPSRGLDDLAYVISTSGSTGTPKAPMLEQSGFVLHTLAMIELLDLDADDVVLQSAPPSFDIAVWQSTTPIVAGARTHIASDDERIDPRALWRVLINEQITVAQLVPSMIRVMLDRAPDRSDLALKLLISTGEALDPQLATRWLQTYPDVPLVNLYGPAECSDDVAVHIVRSLDDVRAPMPIGKAFGGAVLRILDKDGGPVAPGTIGELQVCGDLVGRGYRNDPVRTAESFGTVEHKGQTLRSYRTGDLVFLDDDGLLRYVGRTDFQVKVRGNRVELGEIEQLISSHDQVRTTVVVQLDDGTDRLVAHVETDGALDRIGLRAAVADALPSYMVPSAFVLHRTLPLNVNGKVDRDRLPAPRPSDLVASSMAGRTATTRTERLIAENWAKLLELETVAVDADFFDLGGTSLLAVLSIDDLSHSLGYEIPTRTLITGGTIERIAAALDRRQNATDAGIESEIGTPSMGLVQLQSHPDGVPLFLYPGEAASALGMVDLGRLLAPDRSVYVFEPARPADGAMPPTMAELAQRCRDAIATVVSEPSKPVHVGGFCMGGDVAWEIAHQRLVAGQPTGSVLLLQTERDGVYPSWPAQVGPARTIAAKLWQRVRFEKATAQALARAQRRSHVRHLVIGKALAKVTLVVEGRLHVSGIASRMGLRPSLRLRQERWARSDRKAYHGWNPAALDVPVTVFRASEQPPLITTDDTLGWGSTGTANLRTRVVPGFHWSILHHPSVTALAQTMSEDLRDRDQILEEPHGTPS